MTKKSHKNSEWRPRKSRHRKRGDYIDRLSKRSFKTSTDCLEVPPISFDSITIKIKRALDD
ncbi:MAG: hypothetical protein J6W64_09030 [Bacilli bacterium]|nr:hypothetical protein [Bacilli bacterium]